MHAILHEKNSFKKFAYLLKIRLKCKNSLFWVQFFFVNFTIEHTLTPVTSFLYYVYTICLLFKVTKKSDEIRGTKIDSSLFFLWTHLTISKK